MKFIVSIAVLFICGISFAQSRITSITDSTITKLGKKDNYHSAIQPAIRQVNNWKLSDSTKHKKHRRSITIGANPDLFASYDTSFTYRMALGLTLEYQGEKLYNRTSFSSGWSTRERNNQNHVAFLPNHDHSAYWYNDIRTRFGYTPNQLLHFSFGIDNQFFGDGYRSLIQGDQVAPNPFGMMRVNFWKLEYGLMYQFHNESFNNERLWKYNATHYLSWNATRNFNISLFETVLFQPKDVNYNRGFEVEYLNPIVFFRPQEYSIGSSDNVLLALNASYTIKKHKIYYQMSLDEFFLQEIRNRTKWWANKYGIQLGVKGKIKKLNYRLEGNIVRPYTYSHINYGQNVGNAGRPLGHTLGSNFAEILAMIDFPIKRFDVKTYASFHLKGFDEDSVSWGGDIYESYVTRPKEYGNTIGQGITQRFVQIGAELSYKSIPTNLEAYVQAGLNYSWGESATRLDPMICIGIRSTLFVPRRLF